ncbi:MAG TPA: polymer-forming cytoskeletal protein [Candidatus Aquilonibacter sp.]|nr:polymer-forming cytoskeletal protein [Candidatus Aquilonibacter sp.]
MDLRLFRTPALATLSVLILGMTAAALSDPDYTQVGHDISVGRDQNVGDVTCFGCSIRIRGQVAGDATTFGGSIVVEDQAQVAGDVTAFAGNVRLDEGVKIAGDATVFGGEIRRAPDAQIAGDVTSFGGRAWIPLILLAPFLFLGLLVGGVLWLVQRGRRPEVPAPA